MLKVRFISPWHKGDFALELDDVLFSASLPAEQAHALLCYWEPSSELLAFSGPRAWYCTEPVSLRPPDRRLRLRVGRSFTPPILNAAWLEVVRRLEPADILSHAHPDPAFRVPPITHWGVLSADQGLPRTDKAVAVISNTGETPRRRPPDTRLRLRLATHPRVDLYGKRQAWASFRRAWFSRAALPANYAGELPGYWGGGEKLACLGRYKAAICLENACEPYYFTEKFVDVVRAGCIPVYHAHDTVAAGILANAAWVDPADHGFDPSATLEYALARTIEDYWRRNDPWLAGEALRATSFDNVFRLIGRILRRKLEDRARAGPAADPAPEPGAVPSPRAGGPRP